jgi:voltage-gated sodium channel
MKKLLLNTRFINFLIILNALIIFTNAFDALPNIWHEVLFYLDSAITLIFTLEIILRLYHTPFRVFIKDRWNQFDFIIISLSVISMVASFVYADANNLNFILVLRAARVFKAFRFLRTIPNINHLIAGIRRALKTSVLFIVALLLYNFILAVFTCHIYKDIAPEYFGNPLRALYSIFRIFTTEGWSEIPDAIALNTSPGIAIISILFFISILLTGGILGMSLVNSIFVDAMIADNNDVLDAKVDELSAKIDKLSEQIGKLQKQEGN